MSTRRRQGSSRKWLEGSGAVLPPVHGHTSLFLLDDGDVSYTLRTVSLRASKTKRYERPGS